MVNLRNEKHKGSDFLNQNIVGEGWRPFAKCNQSREGTTGQDNDTTPGLGKAKGVITLYE